MEQAGVRRLAYGHSAARRLTGFYACRAAVIGIADVILSEAKNLALTAQVKLPRRILP
jgi:hypothetical protein